MKRNVFINKGTGGKKSLDLNLVEGGFIKSYGKVIAIGYKSGQREMFLSVALDDIKAFISELEAENES